MPSPAVPLLLRGWQRSRCSCHVPSLGLWEPGDKGMCPGQQPDGFSERHLGHYNWPRAGGKGGTCLQDRAGGRPWGSLECGHTLHHGTLHRPRDWLPLLGAEGTPRGVPREELGAPAGAPVRAPTAPPCPCSTSPSPCPTVLTGRGPGRSSHSAGSWGPATSGRSSKGSGRARSAWPLRSSPEVSGPAPSLALWGRGRAGPRP